MNKSDVQPCRGCGKPVYLATYCSNHCAHLQKLLDGTERQGLDTEVFPHLFWTASGVILVLAGAGMLNL